MRRSPLFFNRLKVASGLKAASGLRPVPDGRRLCSDGMCLSDVSGATSVHTTDRPPAPLLPLVLAYVRHRLALLAAALRPRHRAGDIAALAARDHAPPGG